MTTALVCGLGLVGRRVARQLVDGGCFERVFVTARKARQAESVAEVLGDVAAAVAWPITATTVASVDVVACAVGGAHDTRIAELAISQGVSVASCSDSPEAISQLRALDASAIRAGVAVIGGCGFAPGFTDVLAAHAAELFDNVHDIKIARAGAAGPESIDAVREQRRATSELYRDGVWNHTSRLEEQVWFPEPIISADCQLVRGGGEYLVQHFGPEVSVSSCWAEAKASRWPHRNDDGLGAVRVEVWGTRDGCRDVVVYGAIDRVSSATGAVLGRVTELLADRENPIAPGVRGVAGTFVASDLIRSLGERGLHAAVFEGAPIS